MIEKLLGLCFVLIAGVAYCITDEVMWEQFEFNFASPGARANAMGRAFVGLADDATSAQTNPAGLVLLIRPEFSFENKTTQFTSLRPATSDSLSTGKSTDFGETVNSPAFACFVYPYQNLRIAVFRQEYLNYEESYRLEKRIVPGTERTLFQVDGDLKFKGVHYGLASAYRFSTKLFGGIALRASQLSIDAVQERENHDGPNTKIDESLFRFGVTTGIIYNPSRKISIGGIFELNPRYHFEESYQKRNGTFAPPIHLGIKVPDRYAAGIVFRPTERLTLVSDVMYINYSQLSDNVTVIFNNQSQSSDFRIRNAAEFHIGLEDIMFIRSTAVALRAGFFTNPPHRLRYFGSELPAIAAFNFGKDHEGSAASFTLGGGVSVSNQTEIDAAYLISDPFDEFSLSFVLRF